MPLFFHDEDIVFAPTVLVAVAFALASPSDTSAEAKARQAEAQLEIARKALDPDVFEFAKAQAALNKALAYEGLSTDNYVKACVMSGVLNLALEDEVKATLWFERAFHKSLSVTLEQALGDQVRGYGPKINQRFAEIKREFESSRVVLPTPPEAPPPPPPAPEESVPVTGQTGSLLFEVTEDVGPLSIFVDGVHAGETKMVVFAGHALHTYFARPQPGDYAMAVRAPGGLPSNLIHVRVEAGAQTRVRIRAPEPAASEVEAEVIPPPAVPD